MEGMAEVEKMVVVMVEAGRVEVKTVVEANGVVKRAVEAKGVGVKVAVGTAKAGMEEAKVVEGMVAVAMD